MSARTRLCVLGCMVALAGCDNTQGNRELQTWFQTVRSLPVDAIAPVPKIAPRPPFVYQAQTLRNPFMAAGDGAPGSWQASLAGDGLDENRPRQFLESFDLEQFEMVGTLTGAQQTSALLRVGEVVHRLKTGDYLGRNNGQIVSIDAAQVEVFEVISDGRGGWLERSLTIPLNQQS